MDEKQQRVHLDARVERCVT